MQCRNGGDPLKLFSPNFVGFIHFFYLFFLVEEGFKSLPYGTFPSSCYPIDGRFCVCVSLELMLAWGVQLGVGEGNGDWCSF
jgi:hypothetical protein